jgi:membrane-bound ClpP family serine protease
VGVGVFLMVVGAILAFAVDDDVPGIDLGIAGLILMVAGAAVIAHARHGAQRERVVTRRDETDPTSPPHVVQETTRERRTD